MRKILLCMLVACSTCSTMANPPVSLLQAGAATSNITPPLGTLRVGSFVPFPITHVNDELHARCLVLDDGETKLAMVVCDLLGLHRSVSLEARRLIEAATGIPPSHVMISATHTHSGGSALGISRYSNEQELDDYQRFVARRIADGVQRATNLLRPAEIAFGSIDAPEQLINRRWFVKEGMGSPNPFGKVEQVSKTSAASSKFTKPAGPVDPTLSFMVFREPTGRPIAIYSAYSLHYSGGAGEGHASADYFGFYCAELERLQAASPDGSPVVALMANATSGDIGLNQARYRHVDRTPYGRPRTVGHELAEKVNAAISQLTWQDDALLDARFREPEMDWRPIEPELLSWAKDIEASAPRLPEGNLAIGARWPTTPEWSTRLSYAGRVQSLADTTEPAKFPIQVMRIGDVCIATSPCETYAEIGLEFKQRSPFAKSFMVQLNHAMIGYLPTPTQLELGEYSTWPGTNVLERQTSVKMLNHLVEMANELYRR